MLPALASSQYVPPDHKRSARPGALHQVKGSGGLFVVCKHSLYLHRNAPQRGGGGHLSGNRTDGGRARHHGRKRKQSSVTYSRHGTVESNSEQVKQHKAFYDSMYKLQDYIQDCLAGAQQYDGQLMVSFIDAFGPILRDHLADEIDTLEDLRKYGVEKMRNLPLALNKEANANLVTLSSQQVQLSGSY